MQRILLILNLMFFLVWSGIAQNHRVTRIFKQTDTCLALQVINQTLPVSLSESSFLYLMDEFKCIKAEIITLKPYNAEKRESFTWLSFPRLESKFVKVSRVFNQHNIIPNQMPDFYLSGSYLLNNPLVAASNVFVYAIYNGAYWSDMADLTYVNSTDGYKLSLSYSRNPGQPIRLYLNGNAADPSKTVDLKAFPKQNWLGYWLYGEQNIFSALGSADDKLNMIKHQNWTCVKTKRVFNSRNSGGSNKTWYCDKKNTTVKYGEMVILTADTVINNFSWKPAKAVQPLKHETDTGYFTVETAKDYIPIIVEPDSNDHPNEIGAFINNRCVGATVLNPDDSITVIRAYVKRGETGKLTFRKYYAEKPIKIKEVNDYYVYNRHLKMWEMKAVNNFYFDRFFISFKKEKQTPDDKNSFKLHAYVTNNQKTLTINYYLTDNREVTVTFYDVTGKKVMENIRNRTKGNHPSVIDIQSLKNGIYLLRVSTGSKTAVKRVVVNR